MTDADSSQMTTYRRNGVICERRKRRNFSDEFKKQIVELYNAGKTRADLIREYDLSETSFDRWVRDYNDSGSFKAKDNRTDAENELLHLQKENKRLQMELDIVKQAALILGEHQRKQS